MMPAPPDRILTERLLLRSWHAEDAVRLQPILQDNQEHFADWIPRLVSAPAPVAELADRLAAFHADHLACRSWRFAMLSPDERELYGEVDLFFRSAEGRVHMSEADRVEIGYWLRRDATGRGYATEAARAMLRLAAQMRFARHVEIRCDPANVASAAVPRRLGFRHAGAEADAAGMLWTYDLAIVVS